MEFAKHFVALVKMSRRALAMSFALSGVLVAVACSEDDEADGTPASGGAAGATADGGAAGKPTDSGTADAKPDATCSDAGGPLVCPSLLAGASFSASPAIVKLPLPSLPNVVSGTYDASAYFEGGNSGTEWLSGSVTVAPGGLELALDVPAGAGTIVQIEVCALDLVDACGAHHVLDQFATDDAGKRADLPRFELGDAGATYAPSCRMDYDLCND